MDGERVKREVRRVFPRWECGLEFYLGDCKTQHGKRDIVSLVSTFRHSNIERVGRYGAGDINFGARERIRGVRY